MCQLCASVALSGVDKGPLSPSHTTSLTPPFTPNHSQDQTGDQALLNQTGRQADRQTLQKPSLLRLSTSLSLSQTRRRGRELHQSPLFYIDVSLPQSAIVHVSLIPVTDIERTKQPIRVYWMIHTHQLIGALSVSLSFA